MTTITLEFGDPPDVNVTQPSPPSVAEEIMMSGEVNDSVDIEVSYLSLSPSLLCFLCSYLDIHCLLNSVSLSLTHLRSLFFSFFLIPQFLCYFQLNSAINVSQNLSLITLP